MTAFTVSRLGMDRLGEAYPLIRSAARVSQERWEAFARGLHDQHGGVLAVLAEDARVHGVAAYREIGSLRHGNSLVVEVIATFELSRAARVRQTLCEALERTARDRGCRSLVYTMAAAGHEDRASRRRTSWENLGLEMETVSFVRHIA